MTDAGDQFDLIVTCAFGLEAVLVRELAKLGYEGRTVSTGRVHFRGDALALARANIWLRTAGRVLIPVAEIPAADFEQLFEGVKAIDWAQWIAPTDQFPVNGRSVRSKLTSVPAVQRATKKAIVEALFKQHGVDLLPETGAKVVVEVSILNDKATLTIDTTGDGMHRRGYRTLVGEAGMKESLAAGLVLLSPWNRDRPLVDPFCGTGTIAIEAAMIGRNIAPGLKRKFAAEDWDRIPAEAWIEARKEAEAAILPPLPIKIHASDIDDRALWMANQHAKAAGVDGDVHFLRRDFKDIASKREYGCIITNPPFGERIGEAEEIERLYATFPVVLRGLPTWSFFIITSRGDFEEIIGQPATRRRKLFSAQIECTYYQFLGPKPPSMRKDRQADAPGQQDGPLPDSRAESRAEVQADAPNEVPAGAPAESDAAIEPVLESWEGAEPAPSRHERAGRDAEGEVTGGFAPPPPEEAGQVFGGLRVRDAREIEQFRATLTNNVRHLRRYPSRGITCYRVYEKDSPDVPLVIDRYEDHAHVFEYERGHSRTPAQQVDWEDRCRDVIAEVLQIPPGHVSMKMRARQRGLTQHEKMDESGETFVVHEGGLKFLINLRDYADTGLFLDHRLTRQMVREQASGKRMLNLFGYTGSFSVYAAAGGASSTTTVDLSNTYLEWTRRNLDLNGFRSGGQVLHRTLRSDIREFLTQHPAGQHYDLAVVDPPTYSNSKSTEDDWDVQRDHVGLIRATAALMSPGGLIYFSNNFRRFKLDEEALAGIECREISSKTVPPEYRNKRIHRCWMLRV